MILKNISWYFALHHIKIFDSKMNENIDSGIYELLDFRMLS
jgi:hypothetical protein